MLATSHTESLIQLVAVRDAEKPWQSNTNSSAHTWEWSCIYGVPVSGGAMKLCCAFRPPNHVVSPIDVMLALEKVSEQPL